MRKTAILTDSVACLTPEQVQRYAIDVIPLNFFAGGKLYRDGVDVTPTEAYELFLKDPDTFKTSGANPDDCLNAFRAASKKADKLLCITVSSGISMVNNAAHTAATIMREENRGIKLDIIDSHTAAPSEGMMVLAAARAAEAGADIYEATAAATNVGKKVECIVYLETLKHVYRSGRIPKIASKVGSALNIKPIFAVRNTIKFLGIARSREAWMSRTIEMIKEKAGTRPIHAAIMHAYAPEKLEALRQQLESNFDCVELWETEFSPIMGYACGTGTLGVAFYPD